MSKKSMETILQRPVIFSSNNQLHADFLKILARYKSQKIHFSEDRDDVIEALNIRKGNLLVVDWSLGAEDCTAVLEAASAHGKLGSRPIFLIAEEMLPCLLGASIEYSIKKILWGNVEQSEIEESLEELVHYDFSKQHMKDLEKVSECQGEGNWEEAVACLKVMIDQNPEDIECEMSLADSYFRAGKLDAGLDLLDKILKEDKNNVRALHMKSRYLMKKKNFKEAEQLLLKAHEVSPWNTERLISLGNCSLQLDRHDHGEEFFNQALKIDNKNKDAIKGKAHAKLQNGEMEDGIKLLSQVSSDYEIVSMFNTAGIVAGRHKHIEKSLNLYQLAIGHTHEHDELASKIFFNLGLTYLKGDDRNKAIECFQKALEIDKGFAKAKHNLEILKQGGSPTEKSESPKAPQPSAESEEDEDLYDFDSEDSLIDLFESVK